MMTVSDTMTLIREFETYTGYTAEGAYSSQCEFSDHDTTVDKIPLNIRDKKVSYFEQSFNEFSTHKLRFRIVYMED